MSKKIWECRIGEIDTDELPKGSDLPMRKAIAEAYKYITGKEPDFIFSGWGAQLSEPQRAVVENRLPEGESEMERGRR